MKPKYIIVVFATLLCCSVWAGMQRYCCAEKEMVADMNQALAQTLRHKQEAWITPDTIRDYRSNLRLAVLRRHSLICYADDVDPKTVASSKMAWGRGGRRVVFRGYANCSVASVLALSDQRMPLSLFALSLLWLAGSLMWTHRRAVADDGAFGGLRLDEATQTFYDEHQVPVHFTAMQHQLMLMFFADEHHSLRKEDICQALWPKKPDASDTLYTLVRRLRPVLNESCNLTITTERGGRYQLSDKCQPHS